MRPVILGVLTCSVLVVGCGSGGNKTAAKPANAKADTLTSAAPKVKPLNPGGNAPAVQPPPVVDPTKFRPGTLGF